MFHTAWDRQLCALSSCFCCPEHKQRSNPNLFLCCNPCKVGGFSSLNGQMEVDLGGNMKQAVYATLRIESIRRSQYKSSEKPYISPVHKSTLCTSTPQNVPTSSIPPILPVVPEKTGDDAALPLSAGAHELSGDKTEDQFPDVFPPTPGSLQSPCFPCRLVTRGTVRNRPDIVGRGR